MTTLRTILGAMCLTLACSQREPAAPAVKPEPAPAPAAPAPVAPAQAPALTPAPSPEPTTPTVKAAPAAQRTAATRPSPGAGRETEPVKAAPDEKPAAEPPPLAAAEACGEKGQPRCPLQAWMEDQLQSALDAEDLAALERGLTRVAELAPDPSWNAGANGWGKIAKDGSIAAKGAEIAAVRQACKSCHKAWRNKYKASFRLRPPPK